MRSKNIQLNLLSLLLIFTHNLDVAHGRVPQLAPEHRPNLVARGPKGTVEGVDISDKISDNIPTWFTKELKKIDASEPSIKASKEFIELSKTGAQFLGIAGRAKEQEIGIHVDDADLITDGNNYRWGGDVVGDNVFLSTHVVSVDGRYSALASMFRSAASGRLIDDFSQVTLYNPKGSAEPPYKFLMSKINKMIIVERYRPQDDIAINTLNFGDITYLAWNLYTKQEANKGMSAGDIRWIGLVDLDERAQKFIKEGYGIMKGVDSKLDLSKPGFDRLVLSGAVVTESSKEDTEDDLGGDVSKPKPTPTDEEDPEDDPEVDVSKPKPTRAATDEGDPEADPGEFDLPKPKPTSVATDEEDPVFDPGEVDLPKSKPTPTPAPKKDEPKKDEPKEDEPKKDKPEPEPTPKPEKTPASRDPDTGDSPDARRRDIRARRGVQLPTTVRKRQNDISKEKEVEIDVYNALIAIPSVRDFTFMCVQKRAQLDHRSVNLILTQPNRRSDDDSVVDMQVLLRLSLE
ncbi:hypothetical protein TWF481_008540 [Arthrobotrys musiformis]|uniref:Uncharacterized protein n=1 Tax=Arthrobotrys musiformis TaxID=47236 RepID=A0AAV9W8Y1_9PEZI